MLRRKAGRLFIAAAAVAIVAGTASPARADTSTAAPCRLGAHGCFLDRDGAVRNAEDAYRALHRRQEPAYLRAGIEMALMLGGGTAWYWIDREHNVADWDFPSVKQRLTFEAVRFDNNGFGINFLAHPLNGTAFHTWSRANDLSLAESFGFGLGTSLLWEYGFEFREKVSINDVIVTTSAGVAMGEFLHRLGQYVNSAPGGGWRGVARWTVGVPTAVHHRLDGVAPSKPARASGGAGRGVLHDLWHDLRFSYAWTQASTAGDRLGSSHTLRFDGRLVAIPGYLRPGWFLRPFSDADITALRLRASFGNGHSGRALHADTMLLGAHWQRISAAGRGPAVTVGTSIAYDYVDESHGPWRDRVGVTHLPGLAADLHLRAGPVTFAAHTRLHGDFAGLHAAPFARWQEANPDAVAKSILRKQGYFYGWGWSGRLGASLNMPYLALGGEIFYGRYDSHEGLDRIQDELTSDVEAGATVLDRSLWLRLRPPASRYYAELAASSHRRGARVGSFRDAARLDRYLLRLGAAF